MDGEKLRELALAHFDAAWPRALAMIREAMGELPESIGDIRQMNRNAYAAGFLEGVRVGLEMESQPL